MSGKRLRSAVLWSLLVIAAVSGGLARAETSRYAYDGANRLVRVIAPDGKTTKYTYDASGQPATTERELRSKDGRAQVLITYYRYDPAGRLISIAHVRRSGEWNSLLAGQALVRVASGAIRKIDTFRSGIYDATSGEFLGIPSVAQAFEYDGNARLTLERRTKDGATLEARYEYDAAGNRKTRTVVTPLGAEITHYAYDAADRLTEERTTLVAGGERVTAYEWDGNGNLARRSEPGRVTLYRFDPQNRLIDIRAAATASQAQSAAPSVSYAYDAQGNRVRKRAGDDFAYLIDPTYAFPQLIEETWSTGRSSYVRGLDIIQQRIEGGPLIVELFPLQGHLGTSLGAVDAWGELVETVDSDAFGNLDQAVGLQEGHLFAGEYWDQDSQLLYLRARWYDPKIGRFVGADPLEGKQKNPRSLNRYGYAHSDPVHGTDPSGTMNLAEIGIGAAMVGFAVSAALPINAFGAELADLTPNEKRLFGEAYAEQVLKLPNDVVLRNVRGFAMVNGAKVDLEFDRVFLDSTRVYVKTTEVKWGPNSSYTTNQRVAALQIAQGDVYLTGAEAARNGVSPTKTLRQQFGAHDHVIFTVNANRVLRSDVTKLRLKSGGRLMSHWVVNIITGLE